MVTRTVSKPSEDECEVLYMISIQADEVANFWVIVSISPSCVLQGILPRILLANFLMLAMGFALGNPLPQRTRHGNLP